MLVTVSEYRTIATDSSGNDLPLGGGFIQTQRLTEAGAITLHDETELVRIATDTAVESDIEEEGADMALHMPGAEYFNAFGGVDVTFVVLA